MWTKPWTLREGFIICCGLVVAGLMLELSIGPVIWDSFARLANLMVLVGLIVLCVSIYLLRRWVYAFRFLSTYRAAVPALLFAVALTIIMGLTRQTVDGAWIYNMLSFWPFVLMYVYISVILSQVIIHHILHFRWRRDIPFLLNHLGLFIAITTATLGNADMQQLKMVVGHQQ